MISRRLLWLIGLLAVVTFCHSSPALAQSNPTWLNDAAGRPAPPCMTLNPATGISTPCPAPAGSAGTTGASTTIVGTNGTTTAFGNTWFTGGPITATPTAGLGCVFLTDLNFVCAGQQAGSATSIRVYQSVDGGRTLPLSFTTATTPGNLNATGQLVKSAAGPYYLGLIANGGVGNDPLTSNDLNIWIATNGINVAGFSPTGSFNLALGGPAGNTIIAQTQSNGRLCRVVAPATAWACSVTGGMTSIAGNTPGGSQGASAITYVSGTSWLLVDGASPALLFRSTDDGVTWVNSGLTFAGSDGPLGTHNVLCTTATNCLLHKGDAIYRSVDGGATWSAPVVGPGGNQWQGAINFGGGNVMFLPSFLSAVTANPGCLPNCQNISGAVRTTDGGLTWVPANGPWLTTAGTGGPYQTLVGRTSGIGVVVHGSNNTGPGTPAGRDYGYTTTTPTGISVFNHGEIPVAGPVQAGSLLNSQTTGAVTTAVPITLAGIAGFRVHVYSVQARCGTAAATATVTMTDGGTTVWSDALTQVALVTQNSLTRTPWNTGYTAGDGATVVITLGACSAGAGTLIIQADQF